MNILQDQISEREDFKKQLEDQKKREIKDALDQELQEFKYTEHQRLQDLSQQKMMYRQMLDDQISQKQSTKGSIRGGHNNGRYPPQEEAGDGFSYNNIGRPGYEDIGQQRPGIPSHERRGPPPAGNNIMDRNNIFLIYLF